MAVVSAIIVTYKTRDLLQKCLESLRSEAKTMQPMLHVIVVDNASADGTLEMLQTYPEVELIANQQNTGPATAFNQGISLAIGGSDYLLVMNSDIEVLPGTIQAMYAYLEARPGVDGVCGPLCSPSGKKLFIRTHIWRLRPRNLKRPMRVEWIGTGFGMTRADTFKRIGGYDENYYFFNEDLDWTERAKRSRCRFMFLPEAPVIHHGGQGRKHNMPRIVKELYASNIYYFKRHHPRLAWLALRLFLVDIKGQIGKLQKQLAAGQDQPRGDQLRELLDAYAEARSRMQAEYRLARTPRIPYWPDKRS